MLRDLPASRPVGLHVLDIARSERRTRRTSHVKCKDGVGIECGTFKIDWYNKPLSPR